MEGNIAEKRMKGRQSDITAAGGIATFFLQVIEERTEERGIQILDLECRGRFFQALFGKREKQAEGIPVTGDGMRACLPLVKETLREECLQ